MKFGEIKSHYYDITGKASDVARQLAFVGFAVVWIFRVGTTGITVPVEIVPAALGFALALIFDALQYYVAAQKWSDQVYVADEKCEADDDDCEVPTDINVVPRRFFRAKLWSVGLAYLWLILSIVYVVATGRLATPTV